MPGKQHFVQQKPKMTFENKNKGKKLNSMKFNVYIENICRLFVFTAATITFFILSKVILFVCEGRSHELLFLSLHGYAVWYGFLSSDSTGFYVWKETFSLFFGGGRRQHWHFWVVVVFQLLRQTIFTCVYLSLRWKENLNLRYYQFGS